MKSTTSRATNLPVSKNTIKNVLRGVGIDELIREFVNSKQAEHHHTIFHLVISTFNIEVFFNHISF